MRNIGCLVVGVLIGAAAFLLRDRWMPLLGNEKRAVEEPMESVWQPLTPAGAARARAAVQRLGTRTGPVFTTLRPGDLSAYVFEELSKGITPSAENTEAAVIGDRLHVRSSVRLADFGGSKALGPLAAMLGDRERVEFGGTLDILRTGLAQYHVKTLKVRDFSVPSQIIPRLIRNVNRGSRPPGLEADALPLVIPTYIADVRIRGGRVTLYKAIQ